MKERRQRFANRSRLHPPQVLPTFFLIGIIFAPIGGVLLWASGRVSEFTIDYTECASAGDGGFVDVPSDKFSYHISGDSVIPVETPRWQRTITTANTPIAQQDRCTLQFTVPKNLESSVFMYYKLTNYYQNHRRYVKSYNSGQLYGDAKTAGQLHSDGECKPLDQINNQPVYPCGLIANSVFNGEHLRRFLRNVCECGFKRRQVSPVCCLYSRPAF